MPRLIWSPAALRDVQRLYRFLAARNPAAATRAVQVIRQGVTIIGEHPRQWPAGPRHGPGVPGRIIGFGDSVARYRLEGTRRSSWRSATSGEAGYQ